jgi:hypothetical protein
MTPAWILDTLAALMLVVAAASATRILVAWRRDAFAADTDVAHLLMAIAMAGMLAPGLGTLPGAAWEVVFGLLTAWFAGRVARNAAASGIRALVSGHCAPHLVHSASMLYMFAAVTGPATRTGAAAGMGGMSQGAGSATMTLSLPTLAFVFAFLLVGYAVWDLDQLSASRYATAARLSLARAGQAGVGPVAMPVLVAAESPAMPAPPAPGARSVASAADAGHNGRAADVRAGAARIRGAADAPGRPVVSGVSGGRGGASLTSGPASFLLSPAVTVGCRIAMGITMAIMLLIAL